ncbi:MAG: hypothetical protein IJF83_14655 [Methanobrevibacter sp.]|nr:hypothetical protein [Methanobrevibacter sp.]MBQ2654791.1 hypothetical protein [Methanobrevibacter sp.]
MKYSKLIGIILIVCIAFTFLAVVSAYEVTVCGDQFNIPYGFEKDDAYSTVSKTAMGTQENAVFTNGIDIIYIGVSVMNNGGVVLPTGDNYTDKTVNGVSGKYYEDDTGIGFIYIHGNKCITISFPNDSNSTFEEIVIKPPEDDSGSPFNLFG